VAAAPAAPPAQPEWKPVAEDLPQATACATAPKAAELSEAALVAAAKGDPDVQYHLLRGWICADPDAPLRLLGSLDPAHLEPVLCGLPWQAAYGPNWVGFQRERLHCDNCRAAVADAGAGICPLACASIEPCAARSAAANKAWGALAGGDARTQYERKLKAMRTLRANGALADEDFAQLADAFARLNYSRGEISSEEMWDVDIRRRARTSAVTGDAQLSDEEWALLRKPFGEAKLERPKSVLAAGEAKLAAICDEVQLPGPKLTRRWGIAWITPSAAVWIQGPGTSEEIDPEATGGCSKVLDAVDVDGDGSPEVVLVVFDSDGYSLAIYSIVNGKAERRWSGGGRSG
jgi:hypothetical protein